MDEMTFFRKNAILADLCKEYNNRWAACHGDKEKLMRLVLMRQSAPFFADYCYNGRGLTKDYCKREFGDYVNGRVFDNVDGVDGFTSAMYVDPPTGLEIAVDTAQLLWCDNVDVMIPQTKCPTLYVSNHSSVNITLEGFSSISVYLFDESVVNIEDADDTCDILVYKYNSRAQVETGKYFLGRIKIFNKTLRL